LKKTWLWTHIVHVQSHNHGNPQLLASLVKLSCSIFAPNMSHPMQVSFAWHMQMWCFEFQPVNLHPFQSLWKHLRECFPNPKTKCQVLEQKLINKLYYGKFLYLKFWLSNGLETIKLGYNFCLSSNSCILVILSLNWMGITKDMHIHCIMILLTWTPFVNAGVSKFGFFVIKLCSFLEAHH
jgi:hypothetical protein